MRNKQSEKMACIFQSNLGSFVVEAVPEDEMYAIQCRAREYFRNVLLAGPNDKIQGPVVVIPLLSLLRPPKDRE